MHFCWLPFVSGEIEIILYRDEFFDGLKEVGYYITIKKQPKIFF